MLVNTDSENWNVLFVNDAWSRVTGELGSMQILASITHNDVVPGAPGPPSAAYTLPLSFDMLMQSHQDRTSNRCLHSPPLTVHIHAGYTREDALGKPVFGLFEIPGTSQVCFTHINRHWHTLPMASASHIHRAKPCFVHLQLRRAPGFGSAHSKALASLYCRCCVGSGHGAIQRGGEKACQLHARPAEDPA